MLHLKTVLLGACAVLAFLAAPSHAAVVKLSDLEPYLDTNLTAAAVPCKNYYSDVIALSPSTVDVNIYTTCSSELAPDPNQKHQKFPRHASEIIYWRIDCPTQTLAFLGAKYFRQKLWKDQVFKIRIGAKDDDEMQFGGINPFIQKLATNLCEQLEDTKVF